MEEFDYTEHEGKRILVAVMYMKEAGEAVRAINALVALLQKEPEQSVRILLDVTEGKIFDESTARWKEVLPIMDKHVLKGAVVGAGLAHSVVSLGRIVEEIRKQF